MASVVENVSADRTLGGVTKDGILEVDYKLSEPKVALDKEEENNHTHIIHITIQHNYTLCITILVFSLTLIMSNTIKTKKHMLLHIT